jgi:hypothetical protein
MPDEYRHVKDEVARVQRANRTAAERARERPLLPGTVQIDMTAGRLLRVRQEGATFKALCWRRRPPPNPIFDWHYAEAGSLRNAIAKATGLEPLGRMVNELTTYAEFRLFGCTLT